MNRCLVIVHRSLVNRCSGDIGHDVKLASCLSCCGAAPVACFDVSAFPIERHQHVNIACSNFCGGAGPVAWLYFDAFEMLLWLLFCGYANHQALCLCMFNFVFVRFVV